MTWLLLILFIAGFVALGMYAKTWLPLLVSYIGADSDLGQGLTILVQWVFWGVGGLIGVFRLLGSAKPREGDGKSSRRSQRRIAKTYLTHLVDRYRYLDFRGMGVLDKVPLRLPLVEMYVPLKARTEMPDGETWSRELRLAGRPINDKEAEIAGQRLSEPRPVLDLLRKHDGLIILGDPGSGKTTFLKYVALRLASGDGKGMGLGKRLPVLLPLSAYANVLAKHDVPLDSFLTDYYRGRGIDIPIGPILGEGLKGGRALLLLDGLDEVRELSQRYLVVERVMDFFAVQRQRGNKFILTSRVVGYREVRATCEGFVECTLVDFEEDEIAQFVEKWSHALERAALGDTATAAHEAARERGDLLDAVHRNPGVGRLASNPLLLTILALMKRQGVTLPERRVELYQKYVATLLKNWSLARGLDRGHSPDLDIVEIVPVLANLALWMHQISPGVGLVKTEDMRRRLEEIYSERGIAKPHRAAHQFLSGVREDAGLLVERGPEEYGFIHLTFQEYLAAVAIAQIGERDAAPVIKTLAKQLGDDNWREVSLLVVGYIGIVQQRPSVASDVVLGLVNSSLGKPGEGVVLAGDAAVDAGPGGITPGCREQVIHALQPCMIDGDEIDPTRRTAAGRILSKLGDPREEVLLPEKMEFRSVPAGSFLMGSQDDSEAFDDEKPQYPFDIPYEYEISRFPVTNDQFKAFVEAEGYAELKYWKIAKAAGCWEGGKVKRRYWASEKEEVAEEWADALVDYGEPFNLSNHPVVGINWYEALAFTVWLTDRLRDASRMPPGWEARLPSEAEWEKAARGTDGRIYPWGDKADPNRANYNKTGIGTTNAVGCFPGGASPYGCQDMAGNVWEWTRSVFKDHPYDSKDGREDLNAGNDALRVLRGGAFNSYAGSLRCACRYRSYPGSRLRRVGFRVVLSPLQL